MEYVEPVNEAVELDEGASEQNVNDDAEEENIEAVARNEDL